MKDRKKLRLSGGGLKQYYRSDVHIRLQGWLKPIPLQMKSTSSTTQQCRPFQ